MTATETADILAAWQLIEEHGLSLFRYITGSWSVNDYCGDTPVAAVKAWAEAAGVPWEPPQVVEMFSWKHRGQIKVANASRYGAQSLADADGMGMTVVPCVVVMNREGE